MSYHEDELDDLMNEAVGEGHDVDYPKSINPGQTYDYTSPECNRRVEEERRVIKTESFYEEGEGQIWYVDMKDWPLDSDHYGAEKRERGSPDRRNRRKNVARRTTKDRRT